MALGILMESCRSLGLIGVGLLVGRYPDVGTMELAGWFLLAGIVLFSGSLYVLSMKRIRLLGPITPLGGLSFIIGWVLVTVSVL